MFCWQAGVSFWLVGVLPNWQELYLTGSSRKMCGARCEMPVVGCMMCGVRCEVWGVRCKLKNELKLRWHNGVDIICKLNENLGCTIAS